MNDLEKVSFAQGYLLGREMLKETRIPYDLEAFIQGVRAGEKGLSPVLSFEELQKIRQQLQSTLATQELERHLSESEQFLKKIAAVEGVREAVPGKLYFQELQQGGGEPIDAEGIVSLTYSVKTLFAGNLEEVYRTEGSQEVSLPDTIPGFARGVTGMRKGEKRKLYIHPDLGYGSSGGKVKPNQLLVIDVEIDNSNFQK